MSMEKEGGSLSELMKRANINQTAAYNSLRKLKELKWIEEEQQKDFPFRREFKLTEKGRKAAKVLRELERIC